MIVIQRFTYVLIGPVPVLQRSLMTGGHCKNVVVRIGLSVFAIEGKTFSRSLMRIFLEKNLIK